MKPSRRFRADLAPAKLSASRPQCEKSTLLTTQKQRALNLIKKIYALDRQRDAERQAAR